MIKIIAISFALIFSVLMVALADWFVDQEQIVQKINREHKSEIQKLKKIKKVNEWLNKIVKPSLDNVPKSLQDSDDGLINFFDRHATAFNFQVKKYIYATKDTHNIDISFEIDRNQKDRLNELVLLKRKKGFLQFTQFTIDEKKVKGELRAIQPIYGESNESKH